MIAIGCTGYGDIRYDLAKFPSQQIATGCLLPGTLRDFFLQEPQYGIRTAQGFEAAQTETTGLVLVMDGTSYNFV